MRHMDEDYSTALTLLLLYALVWFVLPFYALFSVYILYGAGFGLVGIGALGSAYNLSSMLGQYSMGRLSDSLRSRRLILLIIVSLMALLNAAVAINPTPTTYALSVVLMGFLAGGFSSTMLAASSELSVVRLGGFISIVRIGGAVGWVVGALTIPEIIRGFNLRYSSLIFLGVLASSTALTTIKVRETYRPGFTARLTLGEWGIFTVYSMLAGLAISSASWFLPVYLYVQHGSLTYLGLVIASGAAAEIPTMLMAGRLFDNEPIYRRYLFTIDGLALSAAFAAYSLTPLKYIYLAQVVRGVGYALFIISVPAFIMRLGVKRGLGSAAFYTSFSLGSIIGGLFGGLLSSAVGIKPLFIILSIIIVSTSASINLLVLRRFNTA